MGVGLLSKAVLQLPAACIFGVAAGSCAAPDRPGSKRTARLRGPTGSGLRPAGGRKLELGVRASYIRASLSSIAEGCCKCRFGISHAHPLPSSLLPPPAGFASIALDAVDAWVSSHLPPLAAGAAASGSPAKAAGRGNSSSGAGGDGVDGSSVDAPAPVAVPRWVDTLLLALDILASTPPKPPPAAAPAGAAATSGAAVGPDAVAAIQAAIDRNAALILEPFNRAQAAAQAAAPQPAAAQAGAAAPTGGDAATNVTAVGQQQQAAAAVAGAAADRTASVTSPAEGAEGGEAAAAAAGAGQPAGEAAQQEQPAAPPQPELTPEERVWQALAAAVQQYSTGGSLSAQEQQRTVDLCLRLLKHLGR